MYIKTSTNIVLLYIKIDQMSIFPCGYMQFANFQFIFIRYEDLFSWWLHSKLLISSLTYTTASKGQCAYCFALIFITPMYIIICLNCYSYLSSNIKFSNSVLLIDIPQLINLPILFSHISSIINRLSSEIP